MDKKKIDVLKLIDKATNSNYYEDFESFKKQGYEAGFLRSMQEENLVSLGGAHDFHLTEKGEKILREERMIEASKKEGIFEAIKKSTEGIQETLGNISTMSGSVVIPTISMPNLIRTPKIEIVPSPEIIIEESNWERHKELLDVQGASLKTQEAILNEQKSTSGLTRWILGLTIAILIITGISIWLRTG